MPIFPVKLPYNPIFLPHLPADAGNMSSVVLEPAQLQVPGDVDTIGDPEIVEGGASMQTGKLNEQVTATFHDGFQIVFPVNSMVIIYTNPDGSPHRIHLDTDAQGHPVPAAAPAPVPAGGANGQGGGRRRRSQRRRSQRRRRTSRRRRYSRRR